MLHVHLRPEAKATPLAYQEWGCFEGPEGKPWAPPAALTKAGLSSSPWPWDSWQEGALPSQGLSERDAASCCQQFR